MPEEGKRVFFERARKDINRLYDILGLEIPPEEEAVNYPRFNGGLAGESS